MFAGLGRCKRHDVFFRLPVREIENGCQISGDYLERLVVHQD